MPCQNFRTLVFNNCYIPEGAIKIHLPQVRQQTDYSCGASAFQAVCKYYRVGPKREIDFIRMLNTTYKCGTCPPAIAKAAKKLGFDVRFKIEMTLDDLRGYLDDKMPVIISMQAWGDEWMYPKALSGHYVVAIGYDDKNFYFEDPSIDVRQRGFLESEELEHRWHDIECDGIDYWHLGIALWKNRYKKPQVKLRTATRIT